MATCCQIGAIVNSDATVKVRYRYTKVGKVRFVGHRDLCRVWERVLRRVGAPLAYSEGFNVRPRLSFGLALPVGAESEAEYMEAQMVNGCGAEVLEAMCNKEGRIRVELDKALPEGVDITGAATFSGRNISLQHGIDSSQWYYQFRSSDVDGIAERLDTIFSSSHYPVLAERKGKVTEEDIRPGILSLVMYGELTPHIVTVSADLANAAAGGGKSVRPGEVAAALAPGISYRIRRTAQWTNRDDPRRDPIGDTMAAGTAPHIAKCAS